MRPFTSPMLESPSPPPPPPVGPPPPPPPPPIVVTITPANGSVSRVGAGIVSESLSINATGGSGSYTGYSTGSSGGSVSSGSTANPSVATTLSVGDDVTFTIDSTVTDSLGATGSGETTVEFSASPPPPPPPPPPTPLGITITPDPNTVHVPGGGTATFTFTAHLTGVLGTGTVVWEDATTGLTHTVSHHAFPEEETNGDVSATVTDSGRSGGGSTASASAEWIADGF